MKKIYHILWLTLMLYQIPLYAGTAVPCPAVATSYENKAVILPGGVKNGAGYFLKNISSFPIVIDRSDHSQGMSAGLSSKLDPGHWSALQISQKDYPLSCSVQKNKRTRIVDCKKVLFVCAPPNLQLMSPDSGVYWLVENKDLGDFLQQLSQKGVKY